MRKYWSYISNGKYSVGCTQRGVYVFDSEGKELAKLKSIRNELHPALSPNSDILVILP